ncbi:cytochrome P450-like protein [Striga asiatica]|uniref:Cytochrome P450-like protein n=1 Tax=Striga asiatica TaxID=4170 RepID=A0A5A7PRP5_STRAF|nr:cytochrome P450-like protein [Striga asiatica]
MDYRIPKGTRIILNMGMLHRDPYIWARPVREVNAIVEVIQHVAGVGDFVGNCGGFGASSALEDADVENKKTFKDAIFFLLPEGSNSVATIRRHAFASISFPPPVSSIAKNLCQRPSKQLQSPSVRLQLKGKTSN